MKIVEMVFVRLVDVPECWRNRGDPNKVNEQSKRLTTQVVFTAAIYEISLTCSVLSWSYCTVRASVRSVFGVVCPRKLLKERAVEQGVSRPLCSLGSLFLIFHKICHKKRIDSSFLRELFTIESHVVCEIHDEVAKMLDNVIYNSMNVLSFRSIIWFS